MSSVFLKLDYSKRDRNWRIYLNDESSEGRRLNPRALLAPFLVLVAIILVVLILSGAHRFLKHHFGSSATVSVAQESAQPLEPKSQEIIIPLAIPKTT